MDSELIGFIKLTTDETLTQAGIMHIVSMIKHRDKAPTNALVAQAVRSCADRKIPHLVYSNFAYGKKETSSLSDFKESAPILRTVDSAGMGRAAIGASPSVYRLYS